jgi:hypothetical protein
MMERKRKALEETWLREQQQIHHLQVSSCLSRVTRKALQRWAWGRGCQGREREG